MSDFIKVYDDALDPRLCEQIIAQFEAGEQHRGKTGHGVDVSKKDSYDLTITGRPQWRQVHQQLHETTLPFFVAYMRKYQFMLMGSLAVTMQDPQTGEPFALGPETFDRLNDQAVSRLIVQLYRPGVLNVQKYLKGVGGYHHWHSEIYPLDQAGETLHRVLFFMYYLNTVEQGGETAFFYQNRSVEPRRGRLVIAPAGFTHTHKGNVPVSEDKYILTSWLLFQRAERLYQRQSPG